MAKNHTTVAEIHENDQHNSSNRATYCPEDNKIRLYIGGDGRVERETYNFLRKNKWTATPKQSCSFVATWHPSTEDTALELIEEGDEIGDEDYSPEERAADRAERFAGYREKRAAEAHGHADTYEDGPAAFGNQNVNRAERQATRHERHRGRALTQWSKAEYWQERTAGVISNALHRSDAATRRGRILTIEAEIRQIESRYTPKENASKYTDEKEGRDYVYCSPGGRGGEWVPVDRLEARKAAYARTIAHLQRRLIYENAMLDNEGGSAAAVEMIPGGWIRGMRGPWSCLEHIPSGWLQIQAVNKSPKTGRIVSVKVWGTYSGYGCSEAEKTRIVTCNIERLGENCYRAPTPEELEAFNGKKAAAKAAKPTISTYNPTDADAQALQDAWNARANENDPRAGIVEVGRMTQAEFSDRLKSNMTFQKTITENGQTFKIRASRGGGYYNYAAAYKVIILTDKPQKPLPIGWNTPAPAEEPAPEPVAEIDTPEDTPEAAAQELVSAPAGCLF